MPIIGWRQEAPCDRRLGGLRLADEWCRRGTSLQIAGQLDEAIVAYENAMALDVDTDACECQPQTPLAFAYLERKQYDRSWDVVHRAQASHRPVASELVQRLEQESGRGR
jgi:hypothetical protein